MQIVCAHCEREDCNKTGAQHLEWYIHCVAPDNVEKMLYKNAFEDDTVIRHLCNALGWDGGTIHQVRDAILARIKTASL